MRGRTRTRTPAGGRNSRARAGAGSGDANRSRRTTTAGRRAGAVPGRESPGAGSDPTGPGSPGISGTGSRRATARRRPGDADSATPGPGDPDRCRVTPTLAHSGNTNSGALGGSEERLGGGGVMAGGPPWGSGRGPERGGRSLPDQPAHDGEEAVRRALRGPSRGGEPVVIGRESPTVWSESEERWTAGNRRAGSRAGRVSGESRRAERGCRPGPGTARSSAPAGTRRSPATPTIAGRPASGRASRSPSESSPGAPRRSAISTRRSSCCSILWFRSPTGEATGVKPPEPLPPTVPAIARR